VREASGATAYSFGFATVLLMRAGYVGWPSDLGLQQQLMSRSRAARSLSMRVVALVSIVDFQFVPANGTAGSVVDEEWCCPGYRSRRRRAGRASGLGRFVPAA